MWGAAFFDLSWTNCLPIALSPNTNTLGLGYKIWENINFQVMGTLPTSYQMQSIYYLMLAWIDLFYSIFITTAFTQVLIISYLNNHDKVQFVSSLVHEN